MSISDTPAAAADEVLDLASKVRSYIAHAKQVAADGLTVAEFGELLFRLMSITVEVADGIPVSGEERKKWVLSAVGALFDELADYVVPLPIKPLWLLFKPGFRALVLKLASGAIEAVLPLIRGGQ
jgi:hypothetical protein